MVQLKTQLTRLALLAIVAMLPQLASAHDFEVDGIYYLKNGNNATVTYRGSYSSSYSNEYTGAVNIPSTVTYSGKTYSVTSIGSDAFSGCTALTSVNISNSVTSIGGRAFQSCSGLTSVTITNSVTSIGSYAFSGCTALTSVNIPNSVTSIEVQAFRGCSGLTSVTIPNSVTKIGGSPFYGCSGLTSMVVESGNSKYDSRNNCNAIIETATNTLISGCKNTIIPNSVTSIGTCAFSDCSGLTSIEIPNSVTSIGSGAFDNCTGLTSATIPNSVTSIGDEAFYDCNGLTSVTIGNSVTWIGGWVFCGCSSLASMVVDNGNTKYDSRNNCNAIIETATNTLIFGCKNTIIPNSVTSIGGSAFSGCSGLTSVTIPNSVTSIGGYAFSGCSGLTSVTIPNSVTTIGGYAFYNCSSLTYIDSQIEDPSIVTMGSNVFDGVNKNSCKLIVPNETSSIYSQTDQWKDFIYIYEGVIFIDGIGYNINNDWITASLLVGSFCSGDIVIPNTITFDSKTYTVNSIVNNAFSNCTDLTSVTIPNSVTWIGGRAFQSCSGLTSVTIPNSVTSIGSYAFSACSSLTSVTLTGQGVWYPKNNMPSINHIKTVNIGSGITSLGNFGFTPDVVNCYAETPPTCSYGTFSNYDGALHVPPASMVSYFTADYWQNFNNLVNNLTEKVTLDKTTVSIVLLQTSALTATTVPEGSNILWGTNNPSVVTVDENGMITATGVGECDIFATLATNSAVYACCHVTVSYPEINITLSDESLEMNLSEERTLTAIITPENTGLTPTWSSSNTSVATVDDNGKVTAIGEGECDITATVLDYTATCHVTVTNNVTISLNIDNTILGANQMLTVYPSCTPDVPVELVVASSDPSVAVVRLVNRTNAPAQGLKSFSEKGMALAMMEELSAPSESKDPALASTKAIMIVGAQNGTATITVTTADGMATPAVLELRVVDVDGDRTITSTDITCLYNYLLNGDETFITTSDTNGDGFITSTDITILYNLMLGN